MTRHTQQTFARTNFLRTCHLCYGLVTDLFWTCCLCCGLATGKSPTCYRETGVMDFGLYASLMNIDVLTQVPQLRPLVDTELCKVFYLRTYLQ